MQVALLRLDIHTIQYHKFAVYIASKLQNYGVYRQLQLLLTFNMYKPQQMLSSITDIT